MSTVGLADSTTRTGGGEVTACYDRLRGRVEPQPGQEIGRYRIASHIGSGGMGTVFSAWDPRLDRVVALKLLRTAGSPAELRARLLLEGQALARLSHPNVVPVYDVGVADSWLFVAMEYVRGPDLGLWLHESKPSVAEIIEIFAQAGRGLAAAHEAGIVHRDFKPSNVVIDAGARARVLDFGLARLGDRTTSGSETGETQPAATSSHEQLLTAAGTVMGTPVYMAPEQHAGQRVDARSDQYAFCVSLFEALFSRRAFDGPTDVLAQVKRKGPPTFPRGAAIPGRLWAVVRRGLEPDPDDRWPDMQSLVAALTARRTRVPWIVAGTAAVAVIGIVALPGASGASEPCAAGVRRIEPVWNSARARDLHAAWSRTELPFAETTWTSAAAALDGFVDRWSQAHADACETPAGSEERDRVMACLGEQLQTADAVLRVLEGDPAQAVESATRTLAELPAPAACASRQGGGASPLAQRLAEARAAGVAGRDAEQRDLARALLVEATDTGDRPAEVEAMLMLGVSLLNLAEPEAAAEYLQGAAFAAYEIERDDLAAAAALGLVSVTCQRHELDAAEAWLRHAESSAARNADDEELAIDLLQAGARILALRGDFEGALAASEEALDRTRALHGENDVRVAAALEHVAGNNHRLGHLELATEQMQRITEIYERTMGAQHPDYADALVNLGGVLYAQRRFDETLDLIRRALAILIAARGADHPSIGLLRSNLGLALLEAGELDEALEVTREALHGTIARYGPDHPEVAKTLVNIGNIHRRRHELDDALLAYERALAAWEAASGPDFPQLAFPSTAIGDTLIAMGEPRRAVAHLRRALGLLDGKSAIELQPAAQGLLAQALWQSGGDRDEALSLATSAYVALSQAGPTAGRDLRVLDALFEDMGATPPG